MPDPVRWICANRVRWGTKQPYAIKPGAAGASGSRPFYFHQK